MAYTYMYEKYTLWIIPKLKWYLIFFSMIWQKFGGQGEYIDNYIDNWTILKSNLRLTWEKLKGCNKHDGSIIFDNYVIRNIYHILLHIKKLNGVPHVTIKSRKSEYINEINIIFDFLSSVSCQGIFRCPCCFEY